jgi:hypothetical protein
VSARIGRFGQSWAAAIVIVKGASEKMAASKTDDAWRMKHFSFPIVIARSEATKQSRLLRWRWIASLRSQ